MQTITAIDHVGVLEQIAQEAFGVDCFSTSAAQRRPVHSINLFALRDALARAFECGRLSVDEESKRAYEAESARLQKVGREWREQQRKREEERKRVERLAREEAEWLIARFRIWC